MNEFRGILEHIGRTPLVPLRRLAAGLPVSVLVKCEHMNPGGSVKDRIALAIVADAEARGLLAPGATLIEATAGNTGVGLALVAAARGYNLACVMPEKMSVDKRVALATLGAQVIITPNAPPSSADNFRNVARRLAEERGWFLTDQFCNPANVRVHAETTAIEILEQTGGRIGAFVAGAGTGGTISGVGLCLKAQVPGVRIVLADPVGSARSGWVETGQLCPDGGIGDTLHIVDGVDPAVPVVVVDLERHEAPQPVRFTGRQRVLDLLEHPQLARSGHRQLGPVGADGAPGLAGGRGATGDGEHHQRQQQRKRCPGPAQPTEPTGPSGWIVDRAVSGHRAPPIRRDRPGSTGLQPRPSDRPGSARGTSDGWC